jgi:hypothetical protein
LIQKGSRCLERMWSLSYPYVQVPIVISDSYDIQERISDKYVASSRCERVRLRLMNQIEVEPVIVLRLGRSRNSVCSGL